MKKKLAATLSVVLILGLAVLGILAYLTSEDSDVNVMTLGEVQIKQHEMQRAEGVAHNAGEAGEGNGVEKGALVEFVQNQALYPAVPTGENPYTAEPNDLFYWGDYVYSGTAGNGLWNDDKLANVMDKIVFVENTGKSDAYVRTLIAFECPEGMEYSQGPDKEFMMNVNGSTTAYAWDEVGYITIDETRYLVMEATYQKVLAPGNTGHPSLLQVVMTHNATNEDMELLGDTYEILVLSQAGQTNGFSDAETALDTMFGESDVNAEKWFKEVLAEHAVSVWNGESDTSWYNDTDTEFELTTAEQLAGLAELVDDGNTFEGKTVKLGKDLDLNAVDANGERVSFDPIGYGYNTVFKGTFDGQKHTISNLYQNGWALGLDYSTEGGGLFASVVDATFKDLTIDNAEIVMECIDMGTLVGYSYGNCTYENITVSNSVIANYNRYTGGVIGEVNGTQTFKNVDVVDTTVSALWGTYDASCGGIIGGKWGEANLTFEDCDVTAKLDVFNDACSNYQYYNYRLCGMLIGNSEEVTDGTATASYLTAKNCTVTYDEWANYTYCEFESNGQGSYNAPDEWKFSRVQEGYAYDGVDSNHTHDTDESHEELMVFDQLFGGNKGVNGGNTHTGVTVVYNNK